MLLWIWSLLYYGKTTYSDDTMASGEPPVGWFWYNFSSTTLGWTAASYLAYFIIYLIVSVVEWAAWCAYIQGDPWFYGLWSRVTTWTSLIFYPLPFIFSLLNLTLPAAQGGITSNTAAGYVNAIMLSVVGLINWLFQWIVHFAFIDRLTDHVQAKDIVVLRAYCTCEKGSGDASAFEAAAKVCYKKLQRDRCQELVQNSLNQKCEGQEEFEKRVDQKTSLYECKSEKVQECSGIVTRSATISTEDYWTKCKAF